ncbi:unnamed protein product [Penicillium salamii]|uniref:glucan endo-1,6-beta-glucosidase n=1 Tax=Penicillium salamii TaxID=1612424 RepID=A0A9W4NAV1_9EURO|nr:unnamed protein product [Penicillium salamii]CAG8144374.1 unnamed protein product [Penicillium salamii]CAG8234957.1 unnamed protein product [Penicillium salamii]CAG8277800.1 unnamed protein product [Penicillium salamii]CAG8298146.1 unnamed protein product [Penicillium salamii]
MRPQSLLPLLGSIPLAAAWLPTDTGRSLSAFEKSGTSKIRGVNLGSSFIIEKWMASGEWNDMGCGDYNSEWGCVKGIGQDAANAAFKKHWQSWITKDDITKMISYGLNTIRIPVGFWLNEDLIADNEYYPRNNALEDFRNICQWAADAGMYVVVDTHGLPGAQQAQQPFTGRWMVEQIQSSDAFKTVGALELVNEPLQNTENGNTNWMVEHFYPSAIDRIRAKESSLGVSDNDALHITVMDDKWDSGGNPTRSLNDSQKKKLLFDDHNYEIYLVRNAGSKGDMISAACGDNRKSDVSPKILGEWSLAFNNQGDNFLPMTGDHASSYSKWFSAQQRQYEALDGWIFWTWKTDENLPNVEQWNYQKAVEAGIINKDLNAQFEQNPC